MQRLQNVWEQLVIIGVLKKSLQTWQRSADSTGASAASGVDSQSVLSGTAAEAKSKEGILSGVQKRDENRDLAPLSTPAGGKGLGCAGRAEDRLCGKMPSQRWISR